METIQIFKYKKGQKTTLDSIYDVQGFIDDCWKSVRDDGLSDDVIITKTVTITVIVKKEGVK